MSESAEVKAMRDKWYSLSKKQRKEYGHSFSRFVSVQSGGLLKHQVIGFRTKIITRSPAKLDLDYYHRNEIALAPVELPEAIQDHQLNDIQSPIELEEKTLVESPYIAELTEPIQVMEWNSVQKKAIERRERLERMRLESIAKRGKIEYVKTTEQYLQSLRARAEKKGIDFDLTPDWIEAKMAYEFCEATGVRFRGKGNDPFGRTIDRKDSSKGYTKANCWVACWMYNRAKMDNTHEDVMEMVAAMSSMSVKAA